MVVLVTCKNEEDPIKNEGASVVTTMLHYPSFLRCSRAANSLIGDGNLTKFKLNRASIVVLLHYKNEYYLFKFKKALEWSQHVSYYKSTRIF